MWYGWTIFYFSFQTESTDSSEQPNPLGFIPTALKGILGAIHHLLPGRDANQINLGSLIQKIAPKIQDAASRIQAASNNGTSDVDVNVPALSQLRDLSSVFPGALRNLLGQARQELQTRLNLGDNIPQALTERIGEVLRGNDPLEAIGNIIQTIIQTYADVSRRSLLLGGLVTAEGIRLSGEVAHSSSNVVIGLRNNTQPQPTGNPSNDENETTTTTSPTTTTSSASSTASVWNLLKKRFVNIIFRPLSLLY